MSTNKSNGNTDNIDGETSQVEPQSQSVQAVEYQTNANDPHYACREWARLAIEAGTAIAIILGVFVALSTLKSIDESVTEARRSANAAEKSANAAIEAASATNTQVEIALQQMEIAKQQIDDARDALRLDQRPWLFYGDLGIESRANNTSPWQENIEPRAGEQFRIHLHVVNTGKTPALNVRFSSTTPILIRVGERPSETGQGEWSPVGEGFVVSPNDAGAYQIIGARHMSKEDFSAYSNREKEVFFWAKLRYCDPNGWHHWTQIGIARLYDSREFTFRASSVSPNPGEANHPDCQN